MPRVSVPAPPTLVKLMPPENSCEARSPPMMGSDVGAKYQNMNLSAQIATL